MSLAERDHPAQAPFPDMQFWTENYCVTGFDPSSGIGFWLHWGRWQKDITQWREVLLLRLPDGTVVAHRAYGNALASEAGPGGPSLAFRVLEPKRKFLMSFLGAACRVQATEMAAGLLRDGPVERVEVSLTFESDKDVWDMNDVSHSQDFAGTGHIEQLGRMTGSIVVGHDRYSYNGLAHRDHSTGPRDARKLSTHHWIQGIFENGIGFALYDAVLKGETKPAFSKAVVYEGTKLYPATAELPYRISRTQDAAKGFPIILTYEKGKVEIEVTSVEQTSYLSFSANNEEYLGIFPSPDRTLPPATLLEQSGLYRLADGTRGYGPMERSIEGWLYVEKD